MAKGQSRQSFDWRDALRLALKAGEAGELLVGLNGGEAKLIHDPGAGNSSKGKLVKALSVRPGRERSNPVVSMGRKSGATWERQGSIGLSPGEVATLRALLEAAIPALLGWSGGGGTS